MKLFWTRQALSDLRSLHAHIASDNERTANEMVARVVARAERQLSRLPGSGRPLPRLQGRDGQGQMCELVISGTPYVLPYRIVGDAIHILRVFRRWPDQH